MKEIRRERIIPAYTVEEVTFVADDGTEFKVEGGIDEATARKRCELYNKSLDKAKLQRAFEKLSCVQIENVDDQERGQLVGVVYSDEEWETLCLFLKSQYYECEDLDAVKNRPNAYPYHFVIWTDYNNCGIWNQYAGTRKDDNGNTTSLYEVMRPEDLLKRYQDQVKRLKNFIAKTKTPKQTKGE